MLDRRVIVDLPRSDESGAVVVLDVTAASNLADFVADIRGDIYDE